MDDVELDQGNPHEKTFVFIQLCFVLDFTFDDGKKAAKSMKKKKNKSGGFQSFGMFSSERLMQVELVLCKEKKQKQMFILTFKYQQTKRLNFDIFDATSKRSYMLMDFFVQDYLHRCSKPL